ncbi:hypothetical protein WMF18_01750 [Sorangium sp. So ce315]|uniref:hypothetical protein n=1 Tax=Sorangium sp. So ce315 TaxID=3133299 RepID=UPI003F5F1915
MSKERIHPSIIVDNWLSGSNDAELEEVVAKHAATLAPLEVAEREHAEALRRCDDAAAALSAAERLFDAEPIEANDRAEKELRAARDLAVSRAERARQRVDDARAAVAVAEKAVAVARLQKARAAVEELATDIRRSSAAARTSYAGAMARSMSTLTRTDEQAIGTIAALRGEIAAVPDELASIERRLLALAPELGPELAGAAAAREEQARADLARRASLSGFQEAIAGDVSALLFAEALAAKARGRIQAALEAQHEAAREAGSEPLDRACLTAYIEHARYLAKPPAERDAHAHASALRGILRPAVSPTRYLSDQDVIELCINATSSGALERSILRLERERAFAAGDRDEIYRRKVEAEMAAEEEATRGMSLAQYELRQREKRYQAEQAEIAARASRKSGKRMDVSIAEEA